MLGPSPALLTQSPSGFTVSEDLMGHPGPSVQETDIQVRIQHAELGCGQIHGSGLSTWAGVWTDTWVRTEHMGWGVDRFGIQWMCLLISLAKCKCPLRSVWHFVPQPVCVWAYVRRSTYFCV